MTSVSENSKLVMNTQRSVRRNIALESVAFGAGELGSMGVGLLTVGVIDKIVPKSLMDKAVDVVAKTCIEPHLDTIEKAMGKCRLEECKVDEAKTREERARRLAKGVVVFSSAWGFSALAKLGIRGALGDKWKIAGSEEKPKPAKDAPIYKRLAYHAVPLVKDNNYSRMIFLADEAAHIGSFVYLNTKASKLTDDHIKGTSEMLKKMGMSEEKAKDVSTMFHVWEVPNFIGLATGLGAIFGKHAYGWPMKHKSQKITDIIEGKADSAAGGHFIA